MRLKILFFLWAFATAAANAMMVQGFDVSKAWDSAVVYVPSNFLPKRVIDVKADAPQPVVILLHGCGGIDVHDRRWAENLKSQGFIVVMPDSLAIPGRSKNCDSTTHTTNMGKIPVQDLPPPCCTKEMEQSQLISSGKLCVKSLSLFGSYLEPT